MRGGLLVARRKAMREHLSGWGIARMHTDMWAWRWAVGCHLGHTSMVARRMLCKWAKPVAV